MSFLMYLIVSTAGIDKLVHRYPKESKPVLLMAIPFMAHEFVNHSILWRVHNLGQVLTEKELPNFSLGSNPDTLYVASVSIGCIITIVSFVAVMIFVLGHYSATRCASTNPPAA